MENQQSTSTNPQTFIQDLTNITNPQMPSVHTVHHNFTYPALSPEVSQVLLIPAHLNDPRDSTARKGFVMGLIGISAFAVYIASFLVTFLDIGFLSTFIGIPICGAFITAVIAPIFGIIFSIRGFKSPNKKGLAIAGLILSIVPLSILLLFFGLVFMVAWSN